MAFTEPAELPLPQRLAVAYSPAKVRPAMAAMLALDARLGRALSGTSEPLLAQMRLAWWREELARPARDRAAGEPVLGAIEEHWQGREVALIGLVDGWEHLLDEAPLPAPAIEAFADGRGMAVAELANIAGVASAARAAERAGRRWALADLAFRTSDPAERECCRVLFARVDGPPERLARALRGLAVLDGLARRAMRRMEPLMAGRGAALAAMRLGMFGR